MTTEPREEGPPLDKPVARTLSAGTDRFVSNAPKLGYARPLDGIRGVGMLMVLLAHANYESFASFAGAVDMFFVASGFLITTLLLEEDRKTSTVNLRHFYIRRALRLLPVLYLTLAVSMAAAVLIGDADLLAKTRSDVLAGALYMYHVVHPVAKELVGGGWPEIRPLIQLWSLSVEEHFYLFGVLVVLVAIKRRLVMPLIAAFFAMWVFIGAARFLGHVGPRFAWYQRPDALFAGITIAFINAKAPRELAPQVITRLKAASNVALVTLIAVIFVGTVFAKPLHIFVPFGPPKGGSLHDGLYWGEFGFSVHSLAMAVIIFTLVRCPEYWLAKFLSMKWLTEIGIRSYAIYVIHVPLAVYMEATLGESNVALAALLYLPLLVILSESAHRFIEKPAFDLRKKLTPISTSGREAK